jgi:hypothetical protein
MNVEFKLSAATSGTTASTAFNISGTTSSNVVSELATGVTKSQLTTGYTINGVDDAITGGTIASISPSLCTGFTTTWTVIQPTPTPTPTVTPTPTMTGAQCYRYRIDENSPINGQLTQYGIRYTPVGSISTDAALNSFTSGLMTVDGNTYNTYSICSQVEPTWLEMTTPTSGNGAVVPSGVFRDGPLGECSGNAECQTI